MSALFEDLIGQPLAVDLLSAALAQGRVAPAYLFAGPEGVGRQLAAVRFFEGLLADGQPSVRERRRLLERNHPDLLWVEPTYQHQGRLLTRAEAEEAGLSRRTPPQLRLEQIRDVVPSDLFDYAKASIAHGVDAAYDGPRGERQKCRAHPSVTGKVLEVVEAAWKRTSRTGERSWRLLVRAWRS